MELALIAGLGIAGYQLNKDNDIKNNYSLNTNLSQNPILNQNNFKKKKNYIIKS